MLVSSLFHEFGHAAALRYGGGQPGAVGGGFYLVYPTLFTNTSDAYRLGRGARLRTDLGGVYFHLLFALVMTGVAVAVDQPVLFAVAVVIDLEVIYQFLPTARLDGYWAVADALGVPDPLSHARLYVASSLQAPSGASHPPAIRPRPAAALALYLSVSFVLVSAIFALTLADLPQIITRVANLVRHHAHTLHEAAVKHDVLVAAAIAAQLVLLALVILAVCLLVYRGARTAAGALRRWSAGSGLRRIGGIGLAASAVAAIALLWSSGFYWAPHIPVSLSKGVAAPMGTRTFDVGSGAAVPVPAPYRQHPPVGGDYAVQWQNCGFYTAPVVDSRAVHSLARGAVWIAYRPGLPRPEVALLHAVAEQLPFILVSPYRGLRSPVVMSAWGRQLSLPGIGDPRLAQFIAAYRLSDSAPEAGKPCAGGIGRPAR
jgi:putative peptide zinc metalloprotease protein